MLSKAKAKCEKYGISPKQISLKLLVPILEYSSLEEDEVLIDKWANLLSNMVDSEQNLQNHVFPSILSQLSINEFNVLSEIYDERTARDSQLRAELKLYKEGKPSVVANYESDINQAKIEVKKHESQLKANIGTTPYYTALSKLKSLENELKNYVEIEETYISKLTELTEVTTQWLEDFEMSNLIRLGLVRLEQEFYANPQSLEIPRDNTPRNSLFNTFQLTKVDFDLDAGLESRHVLTELGFLFFKACKEKSN